MKLNLLIATTLILLASCNQTELADSKRQNDSLASVINERDAALNEYITSFNDIESNLDSVAVRQHLITMNSEQKGEFKAQQKEKINASISAINNLMDQNRKTLSELNRKYKNSTSKNKQLAKAIATLNAQLVQKETELTALNERLNSLNVQVAQLQTSVTSLTDENMAKTQTINEKTAAMHTAYYIIGKSKDLEKAKIIDRKGGLLGMGKTAKLNSDINNNMFTRIDYTETSNIAVNAEAKLITNHPSDSYSLVKDIKDKDKVINISITNPEKFWSESKYLVIVKD